ncbi:MAG: hypothetical protein IEMM0002_0261 [bacterium]|nr:MAG: hypothetical protein IEMM0002_0261 [bacterium]
MTDLKIHSGFKPLGAELNIGKASIGTGETAKSFGQVLTESLNEVNSLQMEADKSIEALVTGRNKNIHETMISISKADLAFRMTMQVRNKILDAYQEVMRMTL